MSALWRTPKRQLIIVFAVLLAIVVPFSTGVSSEMVANLAVAVITACAIDVGWEFAEHRRWLMPSSALLTALIVFFILSPDESWLVLAWTSGFAIIAKRVVRTNREHIFNPAALALVWAPIAFGSGESWWGALGDLPAYWLAVLLVGGIWIVARLNKFPSVLMFLAVYFTFFTGVSMGNPRAVAEMFREPFLQAALFLAFFMLTDPPTSPNQYVDQIWYGAVAALGACVAQLLGAGQVYLLLGLLLSNFVLVAVRYARRRPVTTEGEQNLATQTRSLRTY
ncbi:MAG: RnfABCDGE type electron transport complex subunit D [Chloroflexi bacterium]|nr:RnfABCDGE type electron transport complex subunit D [Chloroflexota bacterium]